MTDIDLESFSSATTTSCRAPATRAPQFGALEFERLWARVWQVACREEEIAEVGDFCEYLIGDQSILVVRSAPDVVGAYHNTCLHRGTRLAEGSGHFDDECIRCRYHAWRYDLDGKLIEVVDPEEFAPMPQDVSPRSGARRPVGRLRVGVPGSGRTAAARVPRPAAHAVGPVPPRPDADPVLSFDGPPRQLEGRRRRLQRGLPRPGHPSADPAVDRRRQPRVRAVGHPLALRPSAQRPTDTATEPAPRADRGRIRRRRDPGVVRRRTGRPVLRRRARPHRQDPFDAARRRDRC